MKKLIITGACLLLAASVFADGWKVGGYLRGGIEGELDSGTVETKTFTDGKYYGIGKSRLRLNIDFSKDLFGGNFRFQNDKFGFNSEDWFKEGNIKYAMAYAKFLDGKIVTEAGKLKDSYTSSDGYEGYNFGHYNGTYGLRVAFTPVENLWVGVQGSTLRAGKYDSVDTKVIDGKAKEGDFVLDYRLLSVSAKYKNENFAIAGGYNLGGEAYGYFGLTAVKNLKSNIEVDWLSQDISGKKNKSGDAACLTTIVEDISYNFKDVFAPLDLGVLAYQKLVEGDSSFEFYPHVSYGFNDLVSVAFETGIKVYADSSKDAAYSFTPSVNLNTGKAVTRVYYTYDSALKSVLGATVNVSF